MTTHGMMNGKFQWLIEMDGRFMGKIASICLEPVCRLVLELNPPKDRPFPFKTRVIWVYQGLKKTTIIETNWKTHKKYSTSRLLEI